MSSAKKCRVQKNYLWRAIFDFMDFWALPLDVLFFILLDFWKLPNEIVPYDTYIIFEKHLRAMLFTKNISKNINTF